MRRNVGNEIIIAFLIVAVIIVALASAVLLSDTEDEADATATQIALDNATDTPTPSDTPEPTFTPTDTPTDEPTATFTPTDTPTDVPTNTPTDTPTDTPTATFTPTDTPTDEPTATDTAAPSDTPTDEPTVTDTPTDEATKTASPTQSRGTGISAATDKETATDEPTATNTDVPSDTPTDEPTATNTVAPSDTPTDTPTVTNTAVPTNTATDEPTHTSIATSMPTATETLMPTPTSLVESAEAITESSMVFMGIIPTPPPTPTVAPRDEATRVPSTCQLPQGWTLYQVQSGNTLFAIALATNSTVDELRYINCIEDVDSLTTGDIIFVPRSPLRPVETIQPRNARQGLSRIGCTDPRIQITSPFTLQRLSGAFTLYGSATRDDFLYYKVEIRPDWATIYNFYLDSRTPVTNGTLGTINAEVFEDGLHWILLTVVDQRAEIPSGATCEIPVIFG